MDLGLAKKVAIVTGAAQGIGRAVALTLAAEGASVAVADINAEGAADVAAEAKRRGGEAVSVQADVSSREEVQAMVDEVTRRLGPADILVNNAALLPAFTTFAEEAASAELSRSWRKLIDVCYFGVINTTAAVLPLMTQRGSGRIVNLGSDAGKVGEPRQAVYAGAKGAIIAFTKSMAKELGRYGITVNAVCPSMTKTPSVAKMLSPEFEAKVLKAYPLRRLGDPQDVADIVVFLAGERAGWITGQAISVNGGYATA